MPEASYVYKKKTSQNDIRPRGVAHSHHYDIFYTHANPPGLETDDNIDSGLKAYSKKFLLITKYFRQYIKGDATMFSIYTSRVENQRHETTSCPIPANYRSIHL